MKSFLIHTVRILSFIALPIGSLFLSIFLFLLLISPQEPLNPYALLFYVATILLFLVFPLFIIFRTNREQEHQTTDNTAAISTGGSTFMNRPIRSALPIIILLAIGLIPAILVILFITGILTGKE